MNAIVEERYNDAIKEAKAVDEMLTVIKDTGELKKSQPFLGIPFTTKESNEAKGTKSDLEYYVSRAYMKTKF